MNDLISVIIPVYNSDKYLKTCVNSIIKQSYQNLEIIIINDGSTDNSLEICNFFKERDDRIVVINQTNKGVSYSRNFGVSIAKGEYIIFIDSDDYIDQNMIEIMHDMLKKENADIVRCANDIVNDTKIIKHERIPESFSNRKIGKKEYDLVYNLIFDISGKKINCYTPLLLFKKKICPLFDENIKYMEDTLFYIKLLQKSENIFFLNKEFYHYRDNSESSSKNVKNVYNNLKDMILVFNKLKNELLPKNHEINALLDINQFYIFISKIDIYIANNIKINSNIYTLLNNQIIMNVNYNMLNKIKKIEYKLLLKKHYILFVLFEKIKIHIKN